jgi:hypothetical protein
MRAAAPADVLYLAIDYHYVFGVAGPRVKLYPFTCGPVQLTAREGDKGAVQIGLTGHLTFREVYSDVAPGVLPAANGLVRLCNCSVEGGRGQGRGGLGGAACDDSVSDLLTYDVV